MASAAMFVAPITTPGGTVAFEATSCAPAPSVTKAVCPDEDTNWIGKPGNPCRVSEPPRGIVT